MTINDLEKSLINDIMRFVDLKKHIDRPTFEVIIENLIKKYTNNIIDGTKEVILNKEV